MVYLVFEPAGLETRAPVDAERVVFLREKFSWPALFFGPLWLLWHRLWLGLLLWLVLFLATSVALALLATGSSLILLGLLVPSLLVAFEAVPLRRRKLLRKGLRDAGTVIAEDLEIAERRFFAEWLKRATPAAPAPMPPAAPLPPMRPSPVIGLFPEPGAGR